MSYNSNLEAPARKIAVYIDLRVARELGIKVPQKLVLTADEVIR
jgi:hypothetical protein